MLARKFKRYVIEPINDDDDTENALLITVVCTLSENG